MKNTKQISKFRIIMKYNCRNMTIPEIYTKTSLQKNTWQTVKIRVNFTTSNYKMFRQPSRFEIFCKQFSDIARNCGILEDFGAMPEMKVYRCRVELHL